MSPLEKQIYNIGPTLVRTKRSTWQNYKNTIFAFPHILYRKNHFLIAGLHELSFIWKFLFAPAHLDYPWWGT